MSLILEYLHKHGIDQIEVVIPPERIDEEIGVIIKGQADLPSDMEPDLNDHLVQWVDDYLYDQYGAWDNNANGQGTLKLWWNENGGRAEIDFTRYIDKNDHVTFSDESKQAMTTEFNHYLHQHPELAKWIKNERIGFLMFRIDYHSGNLDSKHAFVAVEAYMNNKKYSRKKPCTENLKLLKEFTTIKLTPQVENIIKDVAYKHTDVINNASSYLEFEIDKTGLAETVRGDAFYEYSLRRDYNFGLDEQELLNMDDQLPPDLRARMEKALLEASLDRRARMEQKPLSQQTKAKSLGL